MKPGAWIGKSWIPALHFVVGSSHARIQYINFNFSIEKLSTHIAEEQLLFQPHVEPPLLKFPEYYLAYNKLSKQSRKVFFIPLKWSIWLGMNFLTSSVLNLHEMVKLSFGPLF